MFGGPGWTVILSPLVNIVRRPSCVVWYTWCSDSDLSEAFQIQRVSVQDQIETLSKSSVYQGLHAVDCNYTRCQRQFKYIPVLSETLALWLRLPEVLWQRPNVTNIDRKDADNLRASSQGFFFFAMFLCGQIHHRGPPKLRLWQSHFSWQ